ncbi:MAG: VCBS repeat-containing protein, partial [Acidobacteriota bacterium]
MKSSSICISLFGLCCLCSPYGFSSDVEFEKHQIATFADGPQKVVTADIDGDGDIDILSSATGIKIWENIGNREFTRHTIVGGIGAVISVKAEDIDSDGDLDIAAACYDAQSIMWWENTGDLTFVEHVVDNSFAGAHDVYVKDINGDGSPD